MTATGQPPSPRTESIEARRLAEVLSRLRGDGLLQGWLELLINALTLNIPINLAVDGQVFRGYIASTETAAAHLDSQLANWISLAEVETSDSSESAAADVKAKLQESLAGRFSAQAYSRREYEQRTADRLAEIWGKPRGEGYEDRPSIDSLPDDLVSDVVDYLAPRAAITLTDAEILVGETWVRVGLTRVIVSHIGAWWLDTDEREMPGAP